MTDTSSDFGEDELAALDQIEKELMLQAQGGHLEIENESDNKTAFGSKEASEKVMNQPNANQPKFMPTREAGYACQSSTQKSTQITASTLVVPHHTAINHTNGGSAGYSAYHRNIRCPPACPSSSEPKHHQAVHPAYGGRNPHPTSNGHANVLPQGSSNGNAQWIPTEVEESLEKKVKDLEIALRFKEEEIKSIQSTSKTTYVLHKELDAAKADVRELQGKLKRQERDEKEPEVPKKRPKHEERATPSTAETMATPLGSESYIMGVTQWLESKSIVVSNMLSSSNESLQRLVAVKKETARNTHFSLGSSMLQNKDILNRFVADLLDVKVTPTSVVQTAGSMLESLAVDSSFNSSSMEESMPTIVDIIEATAAMIFAAGGEDGVGAENVERCEVLMTSIFEIGEKWGEDALTNNAFVSVVIWFCKSLSTWIHDPNPEIYGGILTKGYLERGLQSNCRRTKSCALELLVRLENFQEKISNFKSRRDAILMKIPEFVLTKYPEPTSESEEKGWIGWYYGMELYQEWRQSFSMIAKLIHSGCLETVKLLVDGNGEEGFIGVVVRVIRLLEGVPDDILGCLKEDLSSGHLLVEKEKEEQVSEHLRILEEGLLFIKAVMKSKVAEAHAIQNLLSLEGEKNYVSLFSKVEDLDHDAFHGVRKKSLHLGQWVLNFPFKTAKNLFASRNLAECVLNIQSVSHSLYKRFRLIEGTHVKYSN